MQVREIKLQSGNEALVRWDFPNQEEFREPAHSLAVLIPSRSMRDLEGNGSALKVRNLLRDLSRMLAQCGFATFRFAPLRPAQESELGPKQLLELYSIALSNPAVSHWNTIVLGFEDSADLLARNYYDFFQVHPPGAAVLLSPTVLGLHLNNFTCPYLTLHGERDPFIQTTPYSKVEEAVHHHQMRYGDESDCRRVRGVGRELGIDEISADALDEIREWVAPLRYRRAKNLQERVAS